MNKNHDENCGCGRDIDEHEHCGCDCDCGEEMDIIYLTLDDGTEVECAILGTFEVDDYEYIALIPVDDEQLLLFRYEEYEDGIELTNIEDEEEFKVAYEAFDSLFADEDLNFFEDFDDEE